MKSVVSTPHSSILGTQAASLHAHTAYKHSVVVACLTGVRVTNSSPLAIAGHADAEGPLAGSVSAVARGTALAELPPVRRRALAALHPRGGDTGDWPCRHQGDVVDVAGAWREVQPVTRGEQQLHLHDPHSQDLHRPYILLQCPWANGAAKSVAILLNLFAI